MELKDQAVSNKNNNHLISTENLGQNFKCCGHKSLLLIIRFDGLANHCIEEEARALKIWRTFFGLFLCFYLFQPDRGVGGAWVDGSPRLSRRNTQCSTKEWEGGGRENEPIVVRGVAQRLLDGCRGPLLMPFWPIVWSVSFAHAPPSSFSRLLFLYFLRPLFSLRPPLPVLHHHNKRSEAFSMCRCDYNTRGRAW